MEKQETEQVEKTIYVCPECKKEFKNPQALKMHINWKHKTNTDLIVEEVEKILPETETREDDNDWVYNW